MRFSDCRKLFLAHVLALTASIVTFAAVRAQDAQPSESIQLVLNKAKVLQLPANASTVVVGNPAVADVTIVRRTKYMVLTGKGFGETNLIALDSQGRSVGESVIRVSASTNSMIVQRGMERETWDCTPRCQPTFSLGDSGKYASENAGQMQSRNSSVGGATQRPAGAGF
ncbi:MAG: pilus assembly protein N-terminal domain-containing protein [Beijerinckiaceae bacterium]|nr:pilus assembly protein N-terminal domain-containing protein [Beijerinckiaceae bacterium]